MSESVPLPIIESKKVEENLASPANSVTEIKATAHLVSVCHIPLETTESDDEIKETAALSEDEVEPTKVEPKQDEIAGASSSVQSANEVPKTNDKKEEEKNVPGTSQSTVEEVDSKRPTRLSKSSAKPPSLRPLLKRRSSRISMPVVSRLIRNVAEETDSVPRTSNRRKETKKRRIALFLESDYPRKK